MYHTAFYSGPFGVLALQGSEQGICSLKLVAPSGLEQKPVPTFMQHWIDQLDAYFNRKLTSFDMPLDWSGHAEFNIAVWKELIKVPYGHTTSYSELAEKIGNPKAVRAVGLANRNNPIAIVVPCHRVLAKNGALHGYFYGLAVKRQLLALENPKSFSEQGSLF